MTQRATPPPPPAERVPFTWVGLLAASSVPPLFRNQKCHQLPPSPPHSSLSPLDICMYSPLLFISLPKRAAFQLAQKKSGPPS